MGGRLDHAEAILKDVLNCKPGVFDQIRDYFNLSVFDFCESCGKEYRVGGSTRLKRHCAECTKLPLRQRDLMALARFREQQRKP